MTKQHIDVIITPPPTPNGGLHVGHLSGPYLRADLNRRLLGRGRQSRGPCVAHRQLPDVCDQEGPSGRQGNRRIPRRDDRVDPVRLSRLRNYISIRSSTTPPMTIGPSSPQASPNSSTTNGQSGSRSSSPGTRGSGPSKHSSPARVRTVCSVPSSTCARTAAIRWIWSGRYESRRRVHRIHRIRGDRTTRHCRLCLRSTTMMSPGCKAGTCEIDSDNPSLVKFIDELEPGRVALTFRSDYGYTVAPGRVVNPWFEIFFAHCYAVGQLLGLPRRRQLRSAQEGVVNGRTPTMRHLLLRIRQQLLLRRPVPATGANPQRPRDDSSRR